MNTTIAKTEQIGVSSNDKTLMITAGILYLLIIVCGISAEVFVRANIIVEDNALLTAQNISDNTTLFIAGFLLDTLMLVCDVFVSVLLYQILKNVSQAIALMAMVMRLIQAAIIAVNLLNYFAASLVLQNHENGIQLADIEQTNLAHFYLQLHSFGYDLGLIFFAFANLLLGFLIMKSENTPRFLGQFLVLAGAVYLLGSLSRFAAPFLAPHITYLYVIPFVAESFFCIWLLSGIRINFKGEKHENK